MPSRKWGFSNFKLTGSKRNSTNRTNKHWIGLGDDTIPLLASSSTCSSDGSMHSAAEFQAGSHQGFSSSTKGNPTARTYKHWVKIGEDIIPILASSSTGSSDGTMHAAAEFQASSHQGFRSSTEGHNQFTHIRGGSSSGPGPSDVTPPEQKKEQEKKREKERIKKLIDNPLPFFGKSFLRYHLNQKSYDKKKRDDKKRDDEKRDDKKSDVKKGKQKAEE